tara:strand:- start:378 stop:671 length:294 start_codon:yes stop_codon:yes gene_type:complete
MTSSDVAESVSTDAVKVLYEFFVNADGAGGGIGLFDPCPDLVRSKPPSPLIGAPPFCQCVQVVSIPHPIAVLASVCLRPFICVEERDEHVCLAFREP